MNRQPESIETVIERTFKNPMLASVNEKGLVKRLDLSQSRNQGRVGIHGVYADGCLIMIVCSFISDGSNMEVEEFALLKDSEGNTYYTSQSYSNAIGTRERASILSFDCSDYKGKAEELNLHLELDTIEVRIRGIDETLAHRREYDHEADYASKIGWRRNHVGEQNLPTLEEVRESWRERRRRHGLVVETFSFDFSVPFIPARRLETSQRVEANGAIVRLREVLVAPSESRIVIEAMPNSDKPPLYFSVSSMVLNVPGEWLGATLGHRRLHKDHIEFTMRAELYDKQGEWTLTVNELHAHPRPFWQRTRNSHSDIDDEYIRQQNLKGFHTLLGPWIFKFTVLRRPLCTTMT